jgi:hypothetical protein
MISRMNHGWRCTSREINNSIAICGAAPSGKVVTMRSSAREILRAVDGSVPRFAS